MEKALLGAGCFWGVEEYFRKLDGIIDTKVGYSGGITINPTYQDVCSGKTEHAEVILLKFDKKIISYNKILEHFWSQHDPTQLNRQGYDVGRQYRSAIFYYDEAQKIIAQKSKENIQKNFSNLIVTEILEAKKFYLAEEYHQLYISKRS